MDPSLTAEEARSPSRSLEYDETMSGSMLSSTEDQSRDESPPSKRQRLQYHCPNCNVDFTEKRALARHKKTQQHMRSTGQEPSPGVPCSICDLSFTREHDLRRHMRRRHGGSSIQLNPVLSDEDESPENVPAINDDIEMAQQAQSPSSHRSSIVIDQADAIADANGGGRDSPDPALDASSTIGECGPPQMNGLEKPTSVKFKIPWSRPESDGKTTNGSHHPTRPRPESRGSAIQRNGRYKTIPDEDRPFCTLCDEPFEDNESDRQQHFRRHFDELNANGGEHRCDVCKFTFSHEEDLVMHQRHALEQNCRTHFGRRIPNNNGQRAAQIASNCSNPNACRYHLMRQEWRHAQLQTLRTEVDSLAAVRRADEGRVLSIEITGHESQSLLENGPQRMRTFASAPCDIGKTGERDVRGLKRRLRKMSGKRTARGIFAKARSVFVRLASRARRTGGLNKALFEAVERADLSEMRQLLDLRADPNFKNASGISVVTIARRDRNPAVLDLLLRYGARSESLSDDPLVHAALTDDVNGIESLIERGADVNRPDHWYGCALSAAAHQKNVASVRVLLRKGADANKRGGSYWTPLCSAIGDDVVIGRRVVEIIDLLIGHGASPDIGGTEGNALKSALIRLEGGKRRWEENVKDPHSCCRDLLERLSGHSWTDRAISRLLSINAPAP